MTTPHRPKWVARDHWGDMICEPPGGLLPVVFRADTAGDAALAAVRLLVERGACGESTTVDVRLASTGAWRRVIVAVGWEPKLAVREVTRLETRRARA